MAYSGEGNGSSMFLLGAIAGAVVGAGVALLVAPKSGAETREDLTAGYTTLRETVARRYKEVADRANEALDSLEEKSAELANQAHA
jgi:gas vesicle protein